MLIRPAIASALLVLLVRAPVHASERDYMQRGEEKLTADYQIKYDRAVRYVLSRAWRKDVVVRMVDIPPFQAEWTAGIARTSTGYQAFEVTASKHIWGELGLGSDYPKRKKRDYHSIRPILHERPMSDALSGRIAALWRRVLADPRNYGQDPGAIPRHRPVHLPRQLFASRATYCVCRRLGSADRAADERRFRTS